MAWAEDRCKDDPRECFDGYDEDGKIKPKDKEVERSFSIPPIKTGFIIDVRNPDVLPHLAMEVFTFEVPKAGDFAADVGVATSRFFTSLTWELIPVIKIGPSIWGGYNVKEENFSFGVGINLLDF